jgi:hypothetical protein
MVDYVLLAGVALFMGCLFAHLAWTGQIKFGTRTLVDRNEGPLWFWSVWTVFVAVVVSGYVHLLITVGSLPGGLFGQ